MKTTTVLLVALGLVSQGAGAQLQVPAASGQGMQMPRTAPPRQAAEPPSSAASSGASDVTGTGAYGSQGAQPGIPPMRAADGMRSEAGTEFNTSPEVAVRPEQKTQNDVAFLCGGVGEDEVGYMKKQAGNYDLALTFATRTGAYLADVDVNIKNAKGDDVLQTKCDGPMLLVNLPASGTYRIHAETSGYSLNRTAKVSASKGRAQRVARVAMVWPNEAGSATATGSSGGESAGASGAGDGQYRDGGSSGWRDHRSPMHPRDGGSTR
jgi:hypothetical protein